MPTLRFRGPVLPDGEPRDLYVVEGRITLEQQPGAETAAEGWIVHHPGFVQHWTPASFGQPWLQDYQAARPERRPDLDLPASDAQTRSPLALAFYWSRFLPPAGGAAPVVLPGFKRDKESDLHFGPAVAGQGWLRWSAPMRHSGLESSPASLAAPGIAVTAALAMAPGR